MNAKWHWHIKTAWRKVVVLASVALVFPVFAADWLYDSAAGTITDRVWTFNATVSGTQMSVGTCTVYPDEVSLLDFSKPVKDASDTVYTITNLNTKFATSSAWKKASNTVASDGSTSVGELILPNSGLTSIGAGAFGCCTELTNVVNFLPDTVTKLGSGAFINSSKLKGDLSLQGLVGNAPMCAFYGCSKIKSVTFGPNFKGTDGYNACAPFQGCSGLTNVVFSPESSGISLNNNAFNAGATYGQPLVLYGVTSIARAVFCGVSVKSVTFDKGIGSVNSETGKNLGPFYGNSQLSEIHFLGAPPTSFSGDYGLPDRTITTYVRRKYANDWLPYAANGEINMKDSTFAAEYVTTPLKRKLLFFDKAPGFMVLVY